MRHAQPAARKGRVPCSTGYYLLAAGFLACVMVSADPLPTFAQADSKVDRVRVDAAIRRGVAFLKGQVDALDQFDHATVKLQSDELVLWTLVHCGVPETDADLQALFSRVYPRNLEATYAVALQAMILEEMDRVKYQLRILQCAQFLVDNQCQNGQWSYGEPLPYLNDVATVTVRKDTATAAEKRSTATIAGKAPPTKPKVARKLAIKKLREGPPSGDNSNSQYAALGMRACHDAGIVIPKEVLRRAMQAWRNSQYDDPQSTEAYPAAGWCYHGDRANHPAYGSMTAGAVGGLCIYHYLLSGKLEEEWKRDKDVQEGLRWLAGKFAVTYNPGPYEHGVKPVDGKDQYYYYLYALERAGILYGTETFGTHEWYAEGAEAILRDQQANGSWDEREGSQPVWDTCFALLFLRRATRPLIDVATLK